MTRLRLLLFVLAAAAATVRVDAAELPVGELAPRAVGLKEIIALALEHSPALGAAVADVDYAHGQVLVARGLDDLSLDGFGQWLDSHRPKPVAGTPVQTTASDDLLGWAQLTQPLPTGGKIGLRLQNEWTRSEYSTLNMDGTFTSTLSTVWAPSLQLVISHSLLRGIGMHTARAQKYKAAALRDQATLLRASTAAVLVRDAVSAYWELAYAREELDIRKASAVSAREQLEIVKANIEVGKQPPSASAEVLVSIALRDEDALFAEQAARERSLELERIVGLSLDARAPRLAAAERATPPEALPPLGDVLDDARQHNPQLLAAYATTRAAAVDVEVTENGMLPQLDVQFAAGPQGSAADAATAFSQLAKFQAYGVTGSLVFSEPIPRHYARGTRQSAEALLHKAKLSADDIRIQIETTVIRLVSQIDVARRRIDVLAPTTDHAALDLEAERARFEVGRATNFDVLRRQEELATARLRQARARTDYLKAVAALGAVTDDILDRYQVVLR
ncbi:MAG: TolC family protein [Polyangia bacterium]